jgi:hypothetical protein
VAAIGSRVSAGSMTSSISSKGGGIERLGVLLRDGGDHNAPAPPVRRRRRWHRVRLRRPSRHLQAHRSQVRARPGHGEQRLVQATAGHRLRTEAVAAAQDPRPAARRAARRPATRCAPDQRLGLGGRSDHIARAVDEGDDEDGVGVAQLRKRAALSAARARCPHRPSPSCCWRSRRSRGRRSGPAVTISGRSAPQDGHRSLVGQRPDQRRHRIGAARPLQIIVRKAVWSAAGPGAVEPGSIRSAVW